MNPLKQRGPLERPHRRRQVVEKKSHACSSIQRRLLQRHSVGGLVVLSSTRADASYSVAAALGDSSAEWH
jgi:hypothetical protein